MNEEIIVWQLCQNSHCSDRYTHMKGDLLARNIHFSKTLLLYSTHLHSHKDFVGHGKEAFVFCIRNPCEKVQPE